MTQDTSSNQPLMTFALFAYNQEKYVREAVEASFAQDYEPLEIILSDDCSTDKTFSIVKKMVAQYKKLRRVLARQPARNSGTFAHVVNVAKKAQGELIFLASGDDISKPNRTTQISNAWRLTGAWGLCSRYDRIDGVNTGTDLFSAATSGVRNESVPVSLTPALAPEWRRSLYLEGVVRVRARKLGRS